MEIHPWGRNPDPFCLLDSTDVLFSVCSQSAMVEPLTNARPEWALALARHVVVGCAWNAPRPDRACVGAAATAAAC